MSLQQRQQYKAQGYRGELKIRDIERNSERPFGEVSNKGRFKFNIEKVPFYNIPDLTGFKLKAYVAHITPKINENEYVERKISVDEELLKDINKQIENAPKGSLVSMSGMDPLSQVSTTKQRRSPTAGRR